MEENEASAAITDGDYMSCPFQQTLKDYFPGDTVDNASIGMPFPEQPDPNFYEIDANGDTILVLNVTCPVEKEESKMRLQVSSLFLASGSPVFQIMFTGDFEEAHRLRENANSGIKTEINLPEDNAEAMKELCEIIHHREIKHNALVPRGLDSVWETTILAQKYNCLHLVKDKFDCYLYRTQKWNNCTDMEAIAKVLVLSSLLDNSEAFRGASEAIIENSNWSVSPVRKLAQSVGAPLAIDWLCDDIENVRDEQLSKLYKGIQDIGTFILEQGHMRASQEGSTRLSTTDCRAQRWLVFGETMNTIGMPPYKRNGNIKDMLRKIKKRSNMKFGGCIGRKCKCRAPDLGPRMVKLADSINIKGLELAEFRTEYR
ncbi:hypothetical protein MGYG_03969 [Paecilomyces variotii No. 5]|uniref:BTB domain-containing protein n=1 Tax=Byssochlamys spectabilis (strain No. 5 / NBRC 109023) TaxID=1356009 RepID=V5FXB7_BYSSN|nr:hypothetical protein MGYG_03969 [Paecilomyces variotii No. 5]